MSSLPTPETVAKPAHGPAGTDAPAGDALLEIDDLNVRYRARGEVVHAVRSVSLRVAPGEIVAIVGESGSGKSTTAHAVLRLLPRSAELVAARIAFAGQDISRLGERRFRAVRGRDIALIPQDPTTSLNPVMRIGAQVAEVLLVHGLADRRSAGREAVRVLADAGMPEPELRARQYPSQLSGGLRQRALIAIAIAARPRLLVADEPTSALDVTVQRRILDHIAMLRATTGTSVLLITHDLGVAAERADRLLVMRAGSVVEQGPPTQLLTDPEHPYTRALIDAAPSLGAAPARRATPRGRRGVGAGVPGVPGDPFAPPRAAVVTEPAPAAASPDLGPEPGPDLDPVSGNGDDGAARQRDDPHVRVEQLVKEYRLPRSADGPRVLRAVDGVSFSIPAGQTFALVGESGSGKSTVARLVLRLTAPDAGRIVLSGTDITDVEGAALRALRRRMQIVYQNPFASLNPRLTVEEIVTDPLTSFGLGTRAQRRARAAELVGLVALPTEMLRRRPAELSGGQRQRVAIARALALAPDLVVCDEPVSALDVSVQAQILDLLERLQDELGVSYLFISHDLAVVRRLAHEVGVMRHGRLVETGPTERIFADPRESYTRELLEAIPGRGRHTAGA